LPTRLTSRPACLVAVSVLSFIALAVVVALGMLYSNLRHVYLHIGCANNLKQLGLIARMYANESRGEYFPPPLLRGFERPDGSIHAVFRFGMDPNSVYPEYLITHSVWLCHFDWRRTLDDDFFLAPDGTALILEWRGPDDGGAVTANSIPCDDPRACLHAVDHSYWYLGFLFDRMEHGDPVSELNALSPAIETFGGDLSVQGEAPAQLVHAYEELLVNRALTALAANDIVALNRATDNGLPVPPGHGNPHGDNVHRVRSGIARFLITEIGNPHAEAEAEASVPIMWDRVAMTPEGMSHHRPAGGNVLYMDGHVAFIDYGAGAPIHEGIARFGAALRGP